MDISALDDLLAHWHSLPVAKGAKVPAKASLSPEALKPHLPNIGIFERISRYDMQVRLFGTRLDEKFDQILTGRNLFDIQPKEHWEFYADLHEATLNTPCSNRMVRETVDKDDNLIRGEGLILPLADQAGEARYAVAMLVVESDSWLDAPLDAGKLHQARIISLEFVDLGHGLPANPPALPE